MNLLRPISPEPIEAIRDILFYLAKELGANPGAIGLVSGGATLRSHIEAALIPDAIRSSFLGCRDPVELVLDALSRWPAIQADPRAASQVRSKWAAAEITLNAELSLLMAVAAPGERARVLERLVPTVAPPLGTPSP